MWLALHQAACEPGQQAQGRVPPQTRAACVGGGWQMRDGGAQPGAASGPKTPARTCHETHARADALVSRHVWEESAASPCITRGMFLGKLARKGEDGFSTSTCLHALLRRQTPTYTHTHAHMQTHTHARTHTQTHTW